MSTAELVIMFLLAFIGGLLGGTVAWVALVQSEETKRFLRTKTLFRRVPADLAKRREEQHFRERSMGDRTIADGTDAGPRARVRTARMRGRRMQ